MKPSERIEAIRRGMIADEQAGKPFMNGSGSARERATLAYLDEQHLEVGTADALRERCSYLEGRIEALHEAAPEAAEMVDLRVKLAAMTRDRDRAVADFVALRERRGDVTPADLDDLAKRERQVGALHAAVIIIERYAPAHASDVVSIGRALREQADALRDELATRLVHGGEP